MPYSGVMVELADCVVAADRVHRCTYSEVELGYGLDFLLLAAAYDRWHREGLFHLIFHRWPEMSLEEFLDWHYLPTVDPVGCFSSGELIGIGWIVQARRVEDKVVCEVGAAFFKGTRLTLWRKSIDLLLDYVFIHHGFDAAYGLCAHGNRYAKLLTRWAGMMPAPDFPWVDESPGDVYMLDQGMWERRRACHQAA